MYLASIKSNCSTTCLAYPTNSLPSGVRKIPLLFLENSFIPISDSSSAIADERLGCVIKRFPAALFIDPAFATSIAYFN